MANKETKWDKMLVGIIKATNKAELVWTVNSFPKEKSETDKKYEIFYKTEVEGENIILYEEKYRDYRGPSISAVTSTFSVFSSLKSFEPDPNEKIWYSRICFEVVDRSNNSLYKIVSSEPLFELFEIVKQKVSGIDKIREKFEKY